MGRSGGQICKKKNILVINILYILWWGEKKKTQTYNGFVNVSCLRLVIKKNASTKKTVIHCTIKTGQTLERTVPDVKRSEPGSQPPPARFCNTHADTLVKHLCVWRLLHCSFGADCGSVRAPCDRRATWATTRPPPLVLPSPRG